MVSNKHFFVCHKIMRKQLLLCWENKTEKNTAWPLGVSIILITNDKSIYKDIKDIDINLDAFGGFASTVDVW